MKLILTMKEREELMTSLASMMGGATTWSFEKYEIDEGRDVELLATIWTSWYVSSEVRLNSEMQIKTISFNH
jgi:hypothetical protein